MIMLLAPEKTGHDPAQLSAEVRNPFQLMTTNEVAALLRIHRNTLNRWRRRGYGPPAHVYPSGITRYQRAQVLTWFTLTRQ